MGRACCQDAPGAVLLIVEKSVLKRLWTLSKAGLFGNADLKLANESAQERSIMEVWLTFRSTFDS